MVNFYTILMFLVGLILLVSGSSFFVDSAVSTAKKLHMPEVLVGATIVSLGTTLPEILFSTAASFRGYTDMALGNALGSILCNTGLIAGTLICFRTIEIHGHNRKNLKANMIFLAISSLIYLFSGAVFSEIPRFSGILLLLTGICFLITSSRKSHTAPAPFNTGFTDDSAAGNITFSDLVRLILEAGTIFMGTQFLLKYGPRLAHIIGIPEIIISLTFIAVGTSLPELVTSLISLKKDHAALSLGNILGANILNFVFVGGLSALISPLPAKTRTLTQEFPFILLLLTILCVPSYIMKQTRKWQGALLIIGYSIYLWSIFNG